MYTPEFVVDQQGFGAPTDWEDHQCFFGVDGPHAHFSGLQPETLPYVYYTPTYAYAHTPFNPYNPYVPGAIIGVDNPFLGPQQYYAVPPYHNSFSSGGAKDAGLGNPYGGLSGRAVTTSTSPAFQDRSASSSVQQVDSGFSGKVPSHHNQFKVGYSEFGSSGHGWVSSEKTRPKFHLGRLQYNVNGPNDSFGGHNWGPRTNWPKGQLAVKAFTTKAGDINAQGTIMIDTDQYNKDDFPLDYPDGNFFVIKSYSEDDVHKSIKYDVWSSTTHGNKKLQSAYEDAQRIAAGRSRGCPVFLFFSVNASGQFCGVAEMIGPVDYHKDMDFWQQDKWSGSFPVRWHFIKDVQNSAFRHIILENNENKPVTNSRDTQEIFYKQGVEMLKIFKNHTLKTSIFDDFMYYESRQKIMQEERARLLVRNYRSPFSGPVLYPPRKLLDIINDPLIQGSIGNVKDPNSVKKETTASVELMELKSNNKSSDEDNIISALKIDKLAINPDKGEESAQEGCSADVAKINMEQSTVVTVGSVPVKVNGYRKGSGSSTAPDPQVLDADIKGIVLP